MSPWAAPSSLARDTQAERVETGKGRLTGHQAAQRRADHEAGRMGQYGAGELPFDGFEQIWQSLSERIWTGVIHLARWCVRGPLVRASETADLFCLIAEETVSHRLWSPGLPACTGSPRNTTPRHALSVRHGRPPDILCRLPAVTQPGRTRPNQRAACPVHIFDAALLIAFRMRQ